MSPCLRERTECWVAMGVTAREGCLQLQPPSQGAKEGQRHSGMGGHAVLLFPRKQERKLT